MSLAELLRLGPRAYAAGMGGISEVHPLIRQQGRLPTATAMMQGQGGVTIWQQREYPLPYAGLRPIFPETCVPFKSIKERVRSLSRVDLDEVEASIAWCRAFDDCWCE